MHEWFSGPLRRAFREHHREAHIDEESSESVSEELLPPAPASPSSLSEEPEMTLEGDCESESEPDAPPDDKTAHDLEVEAVVPLSLIHI